MCLSELVAKWSTRRDEYRRLGVLVDGAILCEEALADLQEVMETRSTETLTLQQAARESGYSTDHLGRLVREGDIDNVGRPNAPRIRRADLPTKSGHLPQGKEPGHLTTTSKRQVALSVVGRDKETTR